MFRKTYKDAVDDIEINKDLKESLMLKAQEIPQPSLKKSPKKPKIYMVSGFAAAAAAVAVSVIALNNTDIFGNNSELIKNETNIQYNNTEQNEKAGKVEKIEKPQSVDTDVTADAKTAEKQTLPKQSTPKSDSPKKTEQAQTSEKKADDEKITQKNENEHVFESVIKEESPETQKQPDASDKAESASGSTAKTEDSEEINSKNAAADSLRSSGGSGGGATQKSVDTVMLTMTNSIEEMTLSEYADYLGADIEKSLVLPKDMKSETAETAYISKDENGNTAYDDFCFYYTGENGRYVSVITSKNTEYAQEMLSSNSYKKETVNGLEWAVTKSEDYKTAVTVKGDVSFTVDSCKLADDEQEKILISISEIEIK